MNYRNYDNKSFDNFLGSFGENGFVRKISLPIITVDGLPGVSLKEVVLFKNGAFAQTLKIGENQVDLLMIQGEPPVSGDMVVRTGDIVKVKVCKNMLGKTVDALGSYMYSPQSENDIEFQYVPIDNTPPGLSSREKITKAFETGVTLIDTLVPLGQGQRELIIGDRKTGKTEFLLQTILSQAQKGTVCVYCGIGKQNSDIKDLEGFVRNNNIQDNTILVVANSSQSLGMMYIAPYSAMSISEYFHSLGHNVMIIIDDLTTHAKSYREISLIANKFPGRSSYPADIFYSHSKLLERAGNFKTPHGYLSITCLPAAETIEGDISGYIQTNLMSMTDGHIFFDKDLFSQGRRPAINYKLSVTRVGRQTQNKLRWTISRELENFLTLWGRTQNFVHFGAEVNEGIKSTLAMGERILDGLFYQEMGSVVPVNMQIMLFSLVWYQLMKAKDIKGLRNIMNKAISMYKTDAEFKNKIDDIVSNSEDFNAILKVLSTRSNEFVWATEE